MTVPEHPEPAQPLAPLPPDEFDAASDAELIRLVRAGDAAAYEHLFLRHRDVAFRYARRISDSERAEDLCAEAFTKILDLLQRGKGPDVAFRAYLLTTVRTSHLNTLRAGNREELVADHEPIARMVPHTDDPDARFDATAICRAFRSLPERWQAALWLTSVEGLSNEEASRHLGVKVNAVASLSFRARAGLRQAYLSEHLQDVHDPQCRRVLELLPSYLRDALTPRRRALVDHHLDTCTSCATAALELSEVNGRLGALLAPLALTGVVATGTTLAAPGPVAAAAGSVVGALGQAGTAVLGAAKAAGSTIALQVKSSAAALSGALGSKVAVAAAVTALGVAVGVEVVDHGAAPAPAEPSQSSRLTILEQRTPRVAATVSAAPEPTAVPAPRRPARSTVTAAPSYPAPTLPPPTTPATHPTPAAAPPAAPASTPPAPSAGPTTSAAPAATRMAVEQPSSTSYTRTGVRWERVLVGVTDPIADTFLTITTTRALNSALATTTGTGWICGTPVMSWFDGGFYATSTTSCTYTGGGDGGPLQLDYQVAPGSVFTATLTPPPGSTTPVGATLRQLVLR